jgi:hypothetical protein
MEGAPLRDLFQIKHGTTKSTFVFSVRDSQCLEMTIKYNLYKNTQMVNLPKLQNLLEHHALAVRLRTKAENGA